MINRQWYYVADDRQVGYLMAAFTEQKQALHDIIAGCLVVDK